MENKRVFIVAYLVVLLICALVDLYLEFTSDIETNESALHTMFIALTLGWGSVIALLLLTRQLTKNITQGAPVPHVLFVLVVIIGLLVGYFSGWLGFLITPLFYVSLLIFTIVFVSTVTALRKIKAAQKSE